MLQGYVGERTSDNDTLPQRTEQNTFKGTGGPKARSATDTQTTNVTDN